MTSFNQMVEQVNDSHQEVQTIVPLLRIIEPTLVCLTLSEGDEGSCADKPGARD